MRHLRLDFNNDGTSDLLWHNLQNGDLVQWLINGANPISIQSIGSIPLGYDIAAAYGDYDASGTSDLLVRGQSDGQTTSWLMDGSQILASVNFGQISTALAIADAQGDYNGDGRSDMLWRGSTDVTLWEVAGTSVVAAASLGPVPASYSIVDGDSDYNGDGKSDILWRGMNDGQTTLWTMNGTQVASLADLGSIPTYLSIVDSRADLDGNGINDIVWRNSANGQVVEWLMQNGAPHVNVLGNIPSELVIVDAHGDYNGDGKTDILWRNTVNGDVVAWTMDGAKIASISDLGLVPLSFNIVDATDDFNHDGISDILWRDINGNTVIWAMDRAAGVGATNSILGIPNFLTLENETAPGVIINAQTQGPYSGTVGNDTFMFGFDSGSSTFTGGQGGETYLVNSVGAIPVPGWDRSDFGNNTIENFKPGIDKIVLPLLPDFSDAGLHHGQAIPFLVGNGPAPATNPGTAYYDQLTGDLYYRESTHQSSASVIYADLVVHLANHPVLTSSDLFVV